MDQQGRRIKKIAAASLNREISSKQQAGQQLLLGHFTFFLPFWWRPIPLGGYPINQLI
jgi:hypothetical protein